MGIDSDQIPINAGFQDALDAMQAGIDALKAAPKPGRNPLKYTIEYDDGSVDVFDLVP